MSADDDDIETLARRLCEADGLDPDEIIAGGVTTFGPHNYGREGGLVPDICLYEPRWRARYYYARDLLIAESLRPPSERPAPKP